MMSESVVDKHYDLAIAMWICNKHEDGHQWDPANISSVTFSTYDKYGCPTCGDAESVIEFQVALPDRSYPLCEQVEIESTDAVALVREVGEIVETLKEKS